MRQYIYREVQTSWGIWIKITCQTHKASEYKEKIFPALSCAFITFFSRLYSSPEELESFRNGLQLIDTALCQRLSESIVVEITDIQYTETDFQIEGLGYALAGWLIQEYHLDVQLPVVTFDNISNSYMFPYTISRDSSS